MLKRVRERVDRPQVRTLASMAGVVVGLHVVGFVLLLAVAPHHRSGATGGLAVGTGLTAYTLGLRHASMPITSRPSTTPHGS
jgi:nickel/cobalt transporter (NiCoT) family protein